MKSKTSFFNKTIFFKNIRRYWLLPAFYLFCYIWAMPVTMYFGFRTPQSYYGYRASAMFNDLEQGIMQGYLMVSLVYAVGAGIMTALIVFGYLQRTSSVNFFHSLPSDRKQMFTTNLLSGLAMIEGPVLVTGIISFIVGASMGFNLISALAAWFLVTLIMTAFFYMFAVICNMLSGQSWFAGAVYVIFLVYVLGMIFLCVAIMSMINVGCSPDYIMPEGVLGISSPLTFFAQKIIGLDDIVKNSGVRGALKEMTLELVTGTIFAVLFTIAAYFLYKYRHSETAGDTVTFRFAKPIFRWGFALSFSMLLTCILLATVMTDFEGSKYIMIIAMVIFGVLGFIIAQMLIKKSVHVFKLAKAQEERSLVSSENKQSVNSGDNAEAVSTGQKGFRYRFKYETACFGVVAFVMALAISFFADKQNRYVPDADEVKSIMLSTDYSYKTQDIYDRNVINEVLSIHHEVIDQIDMIGRSTNNFKRYVSTDSEESVYLQIYYTLNNGKVIRRQYNLPASSIAFRHTEEMYSRKDMMVGLIFGDVDSSNIGAAYLVADTDEGSVATFYKDSEKLYEAFLADVNAGNIVHDDLYIDGYIYQIYNKSEDFYDEEGNLTNGGKGFNKEIPFELIDIDFDDQYARYVVAFSPKNSRNRTFYCVVLSEKDINLLNTLKDCQWFM